MSLWNYRVKRKRRHLSSSAGHHSHHHHHHHHHSHHGKSHYRRKRTWKRVATVLGCIALVLVSVSVLGAGGWYYLRSAGKTSLLNAAASSAMNMGDLQDDEGLVLRNGKKYKYNEKLINILCMGIDKTTQEAMESSGSAGESGQADTIFLLTLNLADNTMKITAISRDTMTEIDMYDSKGNYTGKSKNHLALAYAYGDGNEKSGEMMVSAVSNLLYELPIHGYAAVRMDAIEKINDSVGGVSVTLPEDMRLGDGQYSKGEKVRLSGEQAMSFIRHRTYDMEGSNNFRMERQKQYAISFIGAAKTALRRNPMMAADLYQALTADMVTSIGIDEAVYLASLLPGIRFSTDDIQTLAGTVKQADLYEEFYIDEEALLETIFDTFYVEVK